MDAWKKLDSKRLLEHSRVNVRMDKIQLPHGKIIDHIILENKKSSCMLGLRNNNIVLVRQYRPAVSDFLLEIPAGVCDKGETPEQTAIREFKEESGYIAKNISHLISFNSSPGLLSEKVHVFFSKDIKKYKPTMDEDEDVETMMINKEDAIQKICNAEITDDKTIISILVARQKGLI